MKQNVLFRMMTVLFLFCVAAYSDNDKGLELENITTLNICPI